MLRITRHDQEVAAVTLNEGRMTGPWARNSIASPGTRSTGGHRWSSILSDLLFVDSAGVELLRTLGARGASFRGVPPSSPHCSTEISRECY